MSISLHLVAASWTGQAAVNRNALLIAVGFPLLHEHSISQGKAVALSVP
jgi:hypothetical protein